MSKKVKDNDERIRKGKDEKECKEKSEDTYKKNIKNYQSRQMN